MTSDVIQVRDNEEYVEIVVTGVLSQSLRKGILSLVRCHAHNRSRFLIDLLDTEFTEDEPMIGALELIQYMNDLGFCSETRLAFAADGAAEHRRFFMDLANQNGMNVFYSTSRRSSLNWLSQSD